MSTLSASFSTARSIVKKLVALNVVTLEEHQKISDPFHAETLERDHPPQLNDAQQSAVAAICRQLDQHQSDRFLLDGVTASGKTEVYLHAAAHVLSQNRSVIFLVPEIALTPQLIFRLRARLGDEIAVLHSALSEGARLIMWQKLRAGELRVVVGARSALFAPVRDLGLVCVDEEHDGSYKQEEGVRYNARDMALLRAHRAGAVCVLGSATPSLASVYQVRQGKMQRLHLPDRAHHAAEMPEVELVDLNRHGPGPSGSRLLSLRLHRAIEDNLKQGGQTILFLNRRGFSPSLICEGCGAISECPHCSVALTLHRSGGPQLRCHYCDHSEAVPEQCKSCGSGSFVEEGVGTEKV
jgi:primosomal protein N' (replication factor Y)